MQISGKNHVVVFSGGFDSTYLLLDMINDPSLYDIDLSKDTISTMEIEHSLCGSIIQQHSESNARTNIITKIKEEKPDLVIKRNIVQIKLYAQQNPKERRGLSQPILWACNLIPWLSDGDIVYFGYNRNDQLNVVYPSFRTMLQSMSEIEGFQNHFKVDFKSPLMWFSKKEIIMDMIAKYKPYLDLCRTCESLYPVDSGPFCSTCESCKSLAYTLIEISSSDVSDKMRKICMEYLDKWFHIEISIKQHKVINYDTE